MLPYLPPHKRDTRYALWYETYKIRVPNIQARSVDDVIENGFYISGEEDFDHMTNWHREMRQVSIVRMAALWHQKANIFLVDPKDSEKIYKAISAHLVEWRQLMRGSYNNVIKPPVTDLLILDNFATVIYEHAKFHFEEIDRNSVFMKGHRMLRFSRRAEDELRARMVREREEREARLANNPANPYGTKRLNVTVVNVGEERIAPDTDFSNRPVHIDVRKRDSIMDFLAPANPANRKDKQPGAVSGTNANMADLSRSFRQRE